MLQTETLRKELLEIPREKHTADLASADACLAPNGDEQPEVSRNRDAARMLQTETLRKELLEIPREKHTADLVSADACLAPNGDQENHGAVRLVNLRHPFKVECSLENDTLSNTVRVPI